MSVVAPLRCCFGRPRNRPRGLSSRAESTEEAQLHRLDRHAMEGGAGDALQQVVRLVRECMAGLPPRSLAQRYAALPTGDHDDMLDSGDVVAGALPQNIEKNRCEPPPSQHLSF